MTSCLHNVHLVDVGNVVNFVHVVHVVHDFMVSCFDASMKPPSSLKCGDSRANWLCPRICCKSLAGSPG